MSTVINTTIPTLVLSAHLPDEVEIESLTPEVTVTITIDSITVFSSVYYTYNTKVYVRDIRSIVESAMILNNLSICSFILSVKDMESSTKSTGDIKVIYSQMKSPCGSEDFLLNKFLSTRTSVLLSRTCPFTLFFYAKPFEQSSNYCEIYYTPSYAPDNVLKHTNNYPSKLSDTHAIKSYPANYSEFQYLLSLSNIHDSTISRVSFHIGLRVFNIYFTPDTPSDTFQFRSSFNLYDTVCLFGSTTTKTEVSRSEAVCGRIVSYYDEQTKVLHEVETAPLTLSEARHLTELLTSRHITRQTSEGEFVPVLITDVSPEISDNNTNPVRIKFTWTYADHTEYLPNE